MSQKYFIPSGDLESERLKILHKVYFEPTDRYLNFAGIKNKDCSVVDVGCGTGEMTNWIQTNISGKVTAIDIDPNQIKIAREKCSSLRNKPKFIKHDIGVVSNLDIKADIVYSRFLLHHLPNPEIAIDNLVKMVRAKGKIIIGEPIMDGRWVYPYSEEYYEVYNLHLENKKNHLWQPNYGKSLVSELSKRNDIKLLKYEHFRPILHTKECKRHHSIVLEIFGEELIEKGLVSINDLNNLKEKVNNIVADDRYSTDLFGLVLICAEKII